MTRKKIIAYVALGVLALTVVVAILIPPATGSGLAGGGDAVFVVPLSGPIQESGGSSLLSPGGVSPRFVRERLKHAKESSSIKAVILRLDSPGGTVAASQEIAAMVKDFPEEKPVVVSMGDLAASGGYYIASQADRIVAQPGTLTGSIGVIWTVMDIEGLLEKIGVSMETIKSGKHKDMFQPGQLTPERRAIIQAITDEAYGQFVTAVAEGRGLDVAQVKELATGQVYTGQQAKELGLVDVLGGLNEAIEEAEKLAGIEDARVVEFEPSFLEQLMSTPGLGDIRTLLSTFLLGDDLALLRDFVNGASVPRY